MIDWKERVAELKKSLKLQNLPQAKQEIEHALKINPNHFQLLCIANTIYRASRDYEKSLEYSELLIAHHSDKWKGYDCAARNLVALKRFKEAQNIIQAGLDKIPNQIKLKRLLAFVKTFNGITTVDVSDIDEESLSLNRYSLIAYSSVPNFFQIIQSKRSAIPEQSNANKSYVFVAGLGRSGTTALGKLLNLSSMIAIYTELYPPFRIDGYCQSDFSEEVVLRNLESSHRKENHTSILTKSSDAKLIGDKRPNFQFCAESTFDNLGIENTKCIYIDRSLVDICRSTHLRSENLDDPWQLEKGVEYTILLYNASCRQMIHLQKNRPDVLSSFLFPAYEDVFSSTEKAIELFDFCGVNLSKEEATRIDHYVRSSQKYTNKKIDPSDALEVHIRKSISFLLDHGAHEQFCTITGNRRNYLG